MKERIRMPSLRGLTALAALQCHGRHGPAAASLGITRSALTHRIAQLEGELGIALIARQGRLSALTDEGTSLLAAMGDALERIEAAVQPLTLRRRELRLSTVSTFASQWLLPRLPRFQKMHPGIELTILSTQRVVDLEDENFDCAVRHGLGNWPNRKSTFLFRETLIPAASPSLPLRKPTSWPAILARSRVDDWRVWWAANGSEGECPSPSMIVENRAQALEVAIAGGGVVMTDARYLQRELDAGRLRRLGNAIDLDTGYYFVRPMQGRDPRLLETLCKWLVSEAKSGAT